MGGFRRFLSKANYEAKLHNFSGGVGYIMAVCLLMCTEMVSSIVMYNLGVGPRGPYISANLEGTPR